MAIGPFRFLRGPASRMLTSMLLGITLALSAGCLAGAWWFRTRAPAVALGLAGMLAAGLFAFHQAHGRHGVPQDVAVAASQSLLAVGLVGLLVTGRGPSRLLRRAAAAVVAATPLLGYLLAILLLDACPLYVTEGSGFCYHEHDVLGGWISGVVALFAFDAVVIAVLLLLSARLIDRIVR